MTTLLHPWQRYPFQIIQASLPDPGAGNNLTFPCPVNSRIRICSFVFRLNTVLGGNPRMISHCVDVGGVLCQYAWQPTAQAGGSWRYYFGSRQFITEISMATTQKMHVHVPDDMWLDEGHTWQTDIYNLDPADVIIESRLKYHLYPIGV